MNVNVLFIYIGLCKDFGIEGSINGLKYFKEVIFKDYIQFCSTEGLKMNMVKFKYDCRRLILEGHMALC